MKIEKANKPKSFEIEIDQEQEFLEVSCEDLLWDYVPRKRVQNRSNV